MTVQVPSILVPSGEGAYLTWTDTSGTTQSLTFFVVKEEWPDQGADIAEHPVEIGANISDHIRVKNPKCTLTILATMTPIGSNAWATATAKALSLTMPPGSAALPTIATTLQFSTAIDFVEQLISTLVSLKNATTLFTLVPSKQDAMFNMAISELSYVRDEDNGTGALITLGLQQLRFVQTQQVAVTIPTYPRGATPVNKGQQDPSDDDADTQSSVLASASGIAP